MRFIKYALLTIVIVLLAGFLVANRGPVDIAFAPDFTVYGAPAPGHIIVPVWSVILVSLAIGFLVGASQEYIREGKVRARARAARREAESLQREVETLKDKANLDEDDEIIALTSR